MWYLTKFSLTPFDDRYINIPYEFMEYSYVRFMNKHGDNDLRDDYLYKKREEKKKNDELKELEAQREQLEGSYSKKDADQILNILADMQTKGT